jgi:hypothetical protein
MNIDPKAQLGIYYCETVKIIESLANDCGLNFFKGNIFTCAALNKNFFTGYGDEETENRFDLILYQDWKGHISMDMFWGNGHEAEGISLANLNYEDAKNKILEGIRLINYNKKRQRKLEIAGVTEGYKV